MDRAPGTLTSDLMNGGGKKLLRCSFSKHPLSTRGTTHPAALESIPRIQRLKKLFFSKYPLSATGTTHSVALEFIPRILSGIIPALAVFFIVLYFIFVL